jgi:hypothetical protein
VNEKVWTHGVGAEKEETRPTHAVGERAAQEAARVASLAKEDDDACASAREGVVPARAYVGEAWHRGDG